MLDGKKTYITAGLLAAVTFAKAIGWIDQEIYEIILGLLGSMGLAALRSGVAKQ